MRAILLVFLSACAASTALAGDVVDYQVAGQTFEGYVAKAEAKSKGLVVILHDWDGLTAYEEKRADMLAALGYDAFAVDLYGKGNRPVETAAKKAETAKLYQDRATMRARIFAGLKMARASGTQPVVVIGYCFGGAAALELARSNEVDHVNGIVSFHGGLGTPKGQSYSAKTPPLLIAHGGGDVAVTMKDVAKLADELESAKVPYEIDVYSGAPHAFTVFGSKRYQKVADEKSWDQLKLFLDEKF